MIYIQSILTLFSLSLFYDISFGRECVFIDSISNEYELDLSALFQVEMEYYNVSEYIYTYSVCSNALWCQPKSYPETFVSLAQYDPRGGECWWLAKWDYGVTQPVYNVDEQTWTFLYSGMGCLNTTRNTTIKWHCNPTIEYEIASILETYNCSYSIVIESLYACIDQPPAHCKWFGNNGVNNLDLTELSDTTIIGNDDKDTELVFVYTPCRNGTMCIDINVMVKLENVTTSIGCDSYLGIWESEMNGGQPTYDHVDQIWKFEYNNGEICNGLDSSLFIYWQCDESIVNPPYKVQTEKELNRVYMIYLLPLRLHVTK